jgi:O-acetyl-ADP-ribose deacetylase (regulator of RNase III)
VHPGGRAQTQEGSPKACLCLIGAADYGPDLGYQPLTAELAPGSYSVSTCYLEREETKVLIHRFAHVLMNHEWRTTRWTLKKGNIADEPADVLVCSANPHLTLSGGVGADLLARHGSAMQAALEQVVRQRSPRYIPQGEVVPYSDTRLPYRAVLHAVAIDGWYDSSPQIIEQTLTTALRMAAGYGARRVALAALATGFGHLSLAQFAEGVRPLLRLEFQPIEEVCICLLEDYRVRELAEYLTEVAVVC